MAKKITIKDEVLELGTDLFTPLYTLNGIQFDFVGCPLCGKGQLGSKDKKTDFYQYVVASLDVTNSKICEEIGVNWTKVCDLVFEMRFKYAKKERVTFSIEDKALIIKVIGKNATPSLYNQVKYILETGENPLSKLKPV